MSDEGEYVEVVLLGDGDEPPRTLLLSHVLFDWEVTWSPEGIPRATTLLRVTGRAAGPVPNPFGSRPPDAAVTQAGRFGDV